MSVPANVASSRLVGKHKGGRSLQGRSQPLCQKRFAQRGREWQPLQQPAQGKQAKTVLTLFLVFKQKSSWGRIRRSLGVATHTLLPARTCSPAASSSARPAPSAAAPSHTAAPPHGPAPTGAHGPLLFASQHAASVATRTACSLQQINILWLETAGLVNSIHHKNPARTAALLLASDLVKGGHQVVDVAGLLEELQLQDGGARRQQQPPPPVHRQHRLLAPAPLQLQRCRQHGSSLSAAVPARISATASKAEHQADRRAFAMLPRAHVFQAAMSCAKESVLLF
jgi:hypothetical protein